MEIKDMLGRIVEGMKGHEDRIKKLELEIEGLKAKKKKPAQTRALTTAQTREIQFTPSLSLCLKEDLIKSWADTYPTEFLSEELKKARNWVLSNTHKAPKAQWARFLNTWFSRAWETHRKTLKGNPVKMTVEQMTELLGKKDG